MNGRPSPGQAWGIDKAFLWSKCQRRWCVEKLSTTASSLCWLPSGTILQRPPTDIGSTCLLAQLCTINPLLIQLYTISPPPWFRYLKYIELLCCCCSYCISIETHGPPHPSWAACVPFLPSFIAPVRFPGLTGAGCDWAMQYVTEQWACIFLILFLYMPPRLRNPH